MTRTVKPRTASPSGCAVAVVVEESEVAIGRGLVEGTAELEIVARADKGRKIIAGLRRGADIAVPHDLNRFVETQESVYEQTTSSATASGPRGFR